MAAIDQIKRIVVVMLENRSFDHMLGYLGLAPWKGRAAPIDGLAEDRMPSDANIDDQGLACPPFPVTEDLGLQADLPHQRAEVRTQLAWSPATGQFEMSGFVEAYDRLNPHLPRVSNPDPMAYVTPPLIPVLDALACEYCICDRWFSPIPTETFPNRFMAISGESRIDANGQLLARLATHGIGALNQPTVLRWLHDQGVPWKVYATMLPLKVGGAPFPASFFALSSWVWSYFDDPTHVAPIDRLAADLAQPVSEPTVVFVEPAYSWLKDLDLLQHDLAYVNDDHPPLPIGPGDEFLRYVYSSATANPEAWKQTLLIVTFDEHGGFFDHVPPQPWRTLPPAGASYHEPFETTGPRVPALLISPWAPLKSKYSLPLDHTSILAALARKLTPGKSYSDAVADRLVGAGDIWAALSAPDPRPPIDLPPPAHSAPATPAQLKLAIDLQAKAVFQRLIKAHSALR